MEAQCHHIFALYSRLALFKTELENIAIEAYRTWDTWFGAALATAFTGNTVPNWLETSASNVMGSMKNLLTSIKPYNDHIHNCQVCRTNGWRPVILLTDGRVEVPHPPVSCSPECTFFDYMCDEDDDLSSIKTQPSDAEDGDN